MKTTHKFTLISSLLAASAMSSSGIIILVSDTETTSEIDDFLNANFTNVTEIRNADYANFADPATQDALNGTGVFAGSGAAEVVIIGRNLGSGAYSGGAADGYNALSIPVISFTSYVSRGGVGDRLGWHDGSASNTISTIGAETTLTTEGQAFFGIAGPVDWHESVGDSFNGLGVGPGVGTGDILATVGGQILIAHWDVGDAPANTADADVAVFPGERLLFNLDDDGTTRSTFNSLTPAGSAALVSAIDSVSPLTAVPEPSTSLLGFLALGFLARRRR
ncbi:PEP-CTERM sorting domain-containing protein [Akkermansiaceae bacterium]|nr:PEP-CTERM sorting domain-containing protein [Akkermansiaceae bacterium]MDA7887788.1 PEP-CTERM sorting domain-containing protein [Akkermansiaceae bacterium]MDB4536980.1 PEP-CTERM sorting domain-containing protein [Akkermansiaceae bacterium]